MPELISCPNCEKKLRVPENLMGKAVKCPGCGTTFTAQLEGDEPKPEPSPEVKRPSGVQSGVRRKQQRDEDEEDRPPRRQRDEDEDEERPRRGRAREDEEDEDRPRRRSRVEEDEDEDRPRRRRRIADDDDEDEDYRPRRPGRRQPGRGGLILTFGILSIVSALVGVCCFAILTGPAAMGLGITAWILGHIDRGKIRAGVMDPFAEGATNAGWMCGIIGTVLGALIFFCGILGFFLQVGGLAANPRFR